MHRNYFQISLSCFEKKKNSKEKHTSHLKFYQSHSGSWLQGAVGRCFTKGLYCKFCQVFYKKAALQRLQKPLKTVRLKVFAKYTCLTNPANSIKKEQTRLSNETCSQLVEFSRNVSDLAF